MEKQPDSLIPSSSKLINKMAQINMDGSPQYLLNDIKQVVCQGGNVTHILNVKVSRQPSTEVGNRIRTAIFNFIANVPIQKILNGQPISLTWRTTATDSAAYYHCDAVFSMISPLKSTQNYCSEIYYIVLMPNSTTFS